MDEKILNKPINLQNLSLALAKVKAEYTARIMQSREYAQIETYDAIIKVINNLPGMWVQLSSNLTDSLADCICVRLQDSDTPAVHILVRRQFVESDHNYEFSSLYGDETLSWSDSEQAWIYTYSNSDGSSHEDILVNEALEEFLANAKGFVPEYSRYKEFLADNSTQTIFPNKTDDFLNCVAVSIGDELLIKKPFQEPPVFMSADGKHTLGYVPNGSYWDYDGTTVDYNLSNLPASATGYVSNYVERYRLINAITGVIQGRWQDMNGNISSLDDLLTIKPVVIYYDDVYYVRSPYYDNTYESTHSRALSFSYFENDENDKGWMVNGVVVDSTLEASIISSGRMYIPNKPGITTIICGAGEYNPVTLEPTLAGEEGMTYLVPKPPEEIIPTTIGSAVIGQSTIGTSTYTDPTNGYQEWIYTHGAYERVGEKIATDKEFEDMLKSIGLIDSTAVADEAVVGEALVG